MFLRCIKAKALLIAYQRLAILKRNSKYQNKNPIIHQKMPTMKVL